VDTYEGVAAGASTTFPERAVGNSQALPVPVRAIEGEHPWCEPV